MPSGYAHSAIVAALTQIRNENNSDFDFCNLQTYDKFLPNDSVLWFTICKCSENQERFLTLHFDVKGEVNYPGTSYLRACRPLIVEAIRSFWDGSTFMHTRVVAIP
jgi:hypothetical protein